MNRLSLGILVSSCVAAAVIDATVRTAPMATPCEKLVALTIPDVRVTSVQQVPAGSFFPGESSQIVNVPALCRVVMIAEPTSDSRIGIEVWMPLSAAWNGKLLGTGNGGFAGSIGYPAMASAVTRGYATVGTDTGHLGDQMEFGQGHPEKIIDWAYRAIHVAAETGKLVVRDHYGRFPERSYFAGCSTGGHQALSEAQRFPQDYDGIVAGAPAHNRLGQIFGFLWSWMATHADDGTPLLTPPKLALLTKAAIAACDAQDGLRDGLISDPRQCKFDPAVLLCKNGDGDACLTSRQVEAVRKVYGGARNKRTGAPIFPGWARGTEQGWPQYITAPREPVRVGLFRYFVFHDPNWDWRTFDWDRDLAYVESRVPFLGATSRDYRAFNAHGGKILMYTGLADPVVPPEDTIAYYEAVAGASGGFAETQKFFRFFPVPGMGHCSGGAGPNTFDALAALEQWVERGVAPSRLTASHSTDGRVDRTRPLCPYPQMARYKGAGSIDEAANFACAMGQGNR